MTRVVNIRNKDFDVYIGRHGHGYDGYYGNPIKINVICSECGLKHKSRGSTIPCFRKYFYRRLREDEEFAANVELLKGKVLGCFCGPDKPCHGKVIAEFLDSRRLF